MVRGEEVNDYVRKYMDEFDSFGGEKEMRVW